MNKNNKQLNSWAKENNFVIMAYYSLHRKFGVITSDYGKKEIFRFGFLFDGEQKPMAVSASELGIYE